MRARPLAVAAGVSADLAFGEPPLRPHPLTVFGRVMGTLERHAYADRRSAGVLHALVGVAIGVGAGAGLRSTAAATYLAVAERALGGTAMEIAATLQEGELEGARALLPQLVGRETSGLDEKEVARAVIESVAENTVDALVAPACWAVLAGACGALGYRAVNTLDARVGHRNARYGRFGWASARLDDLANFVPARLTAVLVASVCPSAAGAVLRAVREDAPRHPSPNAGVAEGAFAAALGLRLGGTNRYGERVEVRPSLGDGRPPEPADIARAVELSRRVTVALLGCLVVAGLCT